MFQLLWSMCYQEIGPHPHCTAERAGKYREDEGTWMPFCGCNYEFLVQRTTDPLPFLHFLSHALQLYSSAYDAAERRAQHDAVQFKYLPTRKVDAVHYRLINDSLMWWSFVGKPLLGCADLLASRRIGQNTVHTVTYTCSKVINRKSTLHNFYCSRPKFMTWIYGWIDLHNLYRLVWRILCSSQGFRGKRV